MKINFYPESDNPEFEKAAKEYEKIWAEEGDRITATIEKISGLKFKENIINAIIYKYISWSAPLRLQADIASNHKKGVIVHELCHRLLTGNSINPKINYKDPNYTLQIHKLVNLVLYDAWVELYGEGFAKEEIVFEIDLWNEEGINPYKIAWDWTRAMSQEKRQGEFKKYLPK